MTNPRMVYLLEEETQLNMVQLRDHLTLLSTLASPRFRKDEFLCLPIPLQALSDCFANLARDVGDMLAALRYHYGDPEGKDTEETVKVDDADEGVSNT